MTLGPQDHGDGFHFVEKRSLSQHLIERRMAKGVSSSSRSSLAWGLVLFSLMACSTPLTASRGSGVFLDLHRRGGRGVRMMANAGGFGVLSLRGGGVPLEKLTRPMFFDNEGNQVPPPKEARLPPARGEVDWDDAILKRMEMLELEARRKAEDAANEKGPHSEDEMNEGGDAEEPGSHDGEGESAGWGDTSEWSEGRCGPQPSSLACVPLSCRMYTCFAFFTADMRHRYELERLQGEPDPDDFDPSFRRQMDNPLPHE